MESPQPSTIHPSSSSQNQGISSHQAGIGTTPLPGQNQTHKDPQPNPPSVEAAYKRKCIELKHRLSEIEAENDSIRARNRRSLQYVKKMRLESCILLERLALLTGMMEEVGKHGSASAGGGGNGGGLSGLSGAELKARVVGIMNSGTSTTLAPGGVGKGLSTSGGTGSDKRKRGYIDDETEGSSEERPPTPQERPLRVKRSRKPLTPELDNDKNIANAIQNPDEDSKTENSPTTQTNSAVAAGSGRGNLQTIAPALAGPSSSSKSNTAAADRNGDGDQDVDMKEPKIEDDRDDNSLSDEGDEEDDDL